MAIVLNQRPSQAVQLALQLALERKRGETQRLLQQEAEAMRYRNEEKKRKSDVKERERQEGIARQLKVISTDPEVGENMLHHVEVLKSFGMADEAAGRMVNSMVDLQQNRAAYADAIQSGEEFQGVPTQFGDVTAPESMAQLSNLMTGASVAQAGGGVTPPQATRPTDFLTAKEQIGLSQKELEANNSHRAALLDFRKDELKEAKTQNQYDRLFRSRTVAVQEQTLKNQIKRDTESEKIRRRELGNREKLTEAEIANIRARTEATMTQSALGIVDATRKLRAQNLDAGLTLIKTQLDMMDNMGYSAATKEEKADLVDRLNDLNSYTNAMVLDNEEQHGDVIESLTSESDFLKNLKAIAKERKDADLEAAVVAKEKEVRAEQVKARFSKKKDVLPSAEEINMENLTIEDGELLGMESEDPTLALKHAIRVLRGGPVKPALTGELYGD